MTRRSRAVRGQLDVSAETLVKSCTKRFRGNVTNIAARSSTTRGSTPCPRQLRMWDCSGIVLVLPRCAARRRGSRPPWAATAIQGPGHLEACQQTGTSGPEAEPRRPAAQSPRPSSPGRGPTRHKTGGCVPTRSRPSATSAASSTACARPRWTNSAWCPRCASRPRTCGPPPATPWR